MTVLSHQPPQAAVAVGRRPVRSGHRLPLVLATSTVADDVTLVVAEGEVDAANAEAMGEYALRAAQPVGRVILDLRKIKFFGTAGFAALCRLNDQCTRVGVRWAMMPSPAVARVLRICDPEGVLMVDLKDAGLAAMASELRAR